MDYKCVVLIMVLACFSGLNELIEFSNLVCDSYDKPFADFDYCYLKAFNRTYKYVSVKVRLYKIPITNISVRVAIKKKANGYKPFLYNFTFDACKFMKNQKNGNLLVKYVYSFISKYSNINHTCPYDHDLIVEKVDIGFVDNLVTKVLPWPEGEYGIFTTWIAYNKPRADVNIFLKKY